jgi:hypothetical protein
VRASTYLNNVIGKDHRSIKSRTNVVLGFQRFRSTALTISGIELMHRIRKGQFDLCAPGLKGIAAPVWNAVLFNQQGILIHRIRLCPTGYLFMERRVRQRSCKIRCIPSWTSDRLRVVPMSIVTPNYNHSTGLTPLQPNSRRTGHGVAMRGRSWLR